MLLRGFGWACGRPCSVGDLRDRFWWSKKLVSSGKIEIEKFNGQSFELWKLKMEDLLVDKDQWIIVDSGTKPTGVSNEEWKKLDRKQRT